MEQAKPTDAWLGTGAMLGFASAALFGASTPAAKLLLRSADPWLLAGLLYLGSGLGLALLRLLRGAGGEARLRRADLGWLAGAILAGGAIGPVLLMWGFSTTPAAASALLLNLEGLATMAIAWIVFHEHVDRRIALGAAAILAGALVMSWQGSAHGIGLGALAIAGACLCWGIDNNLTRKISGADPIQIAMLKGLVAGGVNLVLAFARGATVPSLTTTAEAVVVGFFGYGLSLALFVLALRHVGAARTGAYFSTAPFIGAMLGSAFLREPVTPTLIAAGLLMAIGVYLHVAERHAHAHTHEPLEHEHAHTHDAHHQHEHSTEDPPGEPHTHVHSHAKLTHSHPHFPDLHHRHKHG